MVLLLTTTPLLIRILLSKEFLDSQNFIQFAVLAIPLKGLVWVVGYIILAKGNNKLFLTVEIIANLVVLGFNLLFYRLYGLAGLGLSLSLSYLIVTTLMLLILYRRYQFKFESATYKLLIFSMLSLSFCLIAIFYISKPYSVLIQIAIVIISFSFYYFELNNRINIKEVFYNIRNKFNNK